VGRRWREGARRSSIKEAQARDRAPRRKGALGENQKEWHISPTWNVGRFIELGGA